MRLQKMTDYVIFGICFTEKGLGLLKRVKERMPTYDFKIVCKNKKLAQNDENERESTLQEICGEAFADGIPLLFVGAVGIAVRAISPFVRDKLVDSAVVVMDENGDFCIPILSGHMGGANELAIQISQKVGAIPVITTATDVSGAFSVDLFAKEYGLSIGDRKGIVAVSAKALEGKPITMCIKDYPPKELVDVIVSDDAADDAMGVCALHYEDERSEYGSGSGNERERNESRARFVLGVGCKRGKDPERLLQFAEKVLDENHILKNEIYAIATIDQKQNEPAIAGLSRNWRVPLICFEAEALNRAEGNFSASAFVLEKMGTDNVCERAAVLAAGPEAKLVQKKRTEDGMTMAVAEKLRRKR